MRVLRVLLRAVVHGLLRQVGRAVLRRDEVARLAKCGLGDARRVRPHVSDESDRAFRAEFHALVELLRDHHRLLDGEAELARSLLLQLRRDEGRDWIPTALLRRHVCDDELLRFGFGDNLARLLLIADEDFVLLYVLIEV